MGGDNLLYTYTMISVTYILGFIDSLFIPFNMIKVERCKGLTDVKLTKKTLLMCYNNREIKSKETEDNDLR